MKFKIGDEVYLHEDSRWNDGSIANPLGVVGTIDEDNYDDYGVMWSNGHHNSAYTDYDLVLESEIEDSATETEIMVEISQNDYDEMVEQINLLQELLAEANQKLVELDFKPVAQYTLDDWEQAVYNNWMFEQRNGDVVTVNALDVSDASHPVDTDNTWLTLSGREYSNAQSSFDILCRIK